jgi:hypothetical protein
VASAPFPLSESCFEDLEDMDMLDLVCWSTLPRPSSPQPLASGGMSSCLVPWLQRISSSHRRIVSTGVRSSCSMCWLCFRGSLLGRRYVLVVVGAIELHRSGPGIRERRPVIGGGRRVVFGGNIVVVRGEVWDGVDWMGIRRRHGDGFGRSRVICAMFS